MATASDLNAALIEHKTRLLTALGRHQATYLSNLKMWFRQKWTKEEFDRESRKLLGAGTVALHNRFFVALLNKVDPMMVQRPAAAASTTQSTQQLPQAQQQQQQPHTSQRTQSSSEPQPQQQQTSDQQPSLVDDSDPATAPSPAAAPSSRRIVIKRRKLYSDTTYHHPPRFTCADIYAFYAPGAGAEPPMSPVSDTSSATSASTATQLPTSPTRALSPPRFAAQELFLPDAGMVLGRLLCGAWESGLVTAEDEVAEVIAQAAQNLLKNILTGVLLHRKGCRISGHTGDFVYDIGAPCSDLTLRSSLVRRAAPVDDAPMEVDRTISSMGLVRPDKRDDVLVASACELRTALGTRRPRRVNLLDLYRTLSDDRHLIPVHSVMAVNVQRISQLLH